MEQIDKGKRDVLKDHRLIGLLRKFIGNMRTQEGPTLMAG